MDYLRNEVNIMKKILSVFFVLLMVASIITSVPVTVYASNEKYLRFNLNDDGESYCVSGCSDFASGEIVIPDTYKGLPVTAIGENAFNYYLEITSIIIPDSVTYIDEWVFYDCDNIETVIMGNGVTSIGEYSFYDCDKLSTVEMGSAVERIGAYVFYDCSKLKSITISESIKSIGKMAFENCRSLENVYISDIEAWCNIEFKQATNPLKYADNLYLNGDLVSEIVIPDGVTKLPSYSFDCINLKSITIPNSVTSIGKYAFYNCRNLENVYISDIEAWCNIEFKNISSNPLVEAENFYINGELVTDIVVPEGVTSIGAYAFNGCNCLETLTIPDSVTIIGEEAFYNCSNMIGIDVASGNENYSSEDGVLFDKKQTTIVKYPQNREKTSYKIPDTVTSIEDFDYTNVTSLTFGRGITEISYEVFSYNYSLKEVVIPINLTTIVGLAFVEHFAIDEVFYEGGKNQGNNVTDAINNGKLPNARVHYNVDISNIESHYGEPTIVHNATCTNQGEYAYVCACGYSKTETIAKKGHKEGSWKTEKKATVYSAGKKVKKCTECGEILETAKTPQLKCSKPKLSKIENTEYGVKITWSKVSGADKYDVYRKTGSSGKYSKIGTTSKTYYTDKKASSGKKYYYLVKAVNEAGSSDSSSSKSIYHLADTTLSTPKSTKSGITLKWKKVTGADGYMVYRKTGSGSYSKIATVKGNSKVTYTDKKAKKGRTYTYKIKAYKSKTYSAYSNAKKIKDKY